ncbi:ParB/RepB/Spo0J family partition protein [Phenylobacterium sp.]|uniref:ParB/RepB/Spo0J family partition protein n=1 Tax=Phenylobacterium sp. TaxID=1871053 RepID=UPI00272FE849|nr:ParB/RepB/Spo0J family partition protein [Phenylobacterium sp.]MDP1875669.1 ParB/RepB/Spo0J family partition protein [Phenylobacterium sp.]
MAQPVLTPLILQNAEVLRSLRDSTYATVAELADELGRDRSNLTKSLKALEAAGLIGPDPGLSLAALTPAGTTAVAALDRADRIDADGAPANMPPGFALIPHQLIVPDGLNPRKHFDEAELAELAESIAQDGLLENLVVRPIAEGDTAHRLVAGERRWRALRLLIAAGRWDQPIPCKVVEIDDAAHRRIALVENLQRKDLRPIDEAQALKDLMEVTGQGTAEIAKEIGFTQRFVQQRLQLLGLPDTVQDQVNAGEVTIEKARAIAAVLPDLPADKAKALTTGKMTPEQAKTWLENQPKLRDDLTPRQWLILLELADCSARTADNLWASAEVGAAIADDPDWTALVDAWGYMVHGPHAIFDTGFETGRLRANVYSWGGGKQLALKFGPDLEKEGPRQTYLAQARAAAGVEFPLAFEPGQYATPWLNGPFEVDPAIQAKVDQAKAERAAAMAAREQAEREAAERQEQASQTVQSILVKHRERDLPPLDSGYADAFAAFEIALPVTVAPNGDVVDAAGRQLVRSGWGQAPPPLILGRNTLLALAINAAAGLYTPNHPKPAGDGPAIPRKDFVELIAGCLLDDIDDLDGTEANLMAERGLAAYLAAESIQYGDPAHDWEEVGAMAIAQGIREDGLGQAEPADEDAGALETEEA